MMNEPIQCLASMTCACVVGHVDEYNTTHVLCTYRPSWSIPAKNQIRSLDRTALLSSVLDFKLSNWNIRRLVESES